MHKKDYDLLAKTLAREHLDAERFGKRGDTGLVERTVLAIAQALAKEDTAFQPVTWILGACGVRAASQLTTAAQEAIRERYGTTRREPYIAKGDRAREAKALARAFAAKIGVNHWDVGVRYRGPRDGYELEWANGPTWKKAQAMVDEMLASGRYPAMAGTHLRLSRTYGGQAFAARIVAAVREDEAGVRAEVARRVAARNSFGNRIFEPDPERDEQNALDDYVRELIDTTENPQLASNEADEPIIDRLMDAARGSDCSMPRLVLAKDPMIFAGVVPDDIVQLDQHRKRQRGDA